MTDLSATEHLAGNAPIAQSTFGVEHDATANNFVTITQSNTGTIDIFTGANKRWTYAATITNAPTIGENDTLAFAVDHNGRIMVVTQTSAGCQYQLGTIAGGFSAPSSITGPSFGRRSSVTLDECYDVASFTSENPFFVHGKVGEFKLKS
eukprot:TRINITY_DN12420_c1_g2_i1.p2 TRINITY_DN12420_c1_g2~~TRINITY_DN12420_c1_g2_i1.p2  ORF type:complete len:150 (-),score=34.64 TRINITY_DN12420_c1_g2_i1:59-508(-)